MGAYDPQYAHEYYMKHRQLKGRGKGTSSQAKTYRKASTSGLGLSSEQRAQLKETWEGLKEELSQERDEIAEAKKAAIEALNENIKAKIEQFKRQIEASKAQYKEGSISKAQYENMKTAAQGEVSKLREQKTAGRDAIKTAAQNDLEKAKEKCYSSYQNAVDAAARNPQGGKKSSSKKSSSSKGGNTAKMNQIKAAAFAKVKK